MTIESETQFAFYARLRSAQQLIWSQFNVDNASIHPTMYQQTIDTCLVTGLNKNILEKMYKLVICWQINLEGSFCTKVINQDQLS